MQLFGQRGGQPAIRPVYVHYTFDLGLPHDHDGSVARTQHAGSVGGAEDHGLSTELT